MLAFLIVMDAGLAFNSRLLKSGFGPELAVAPIASADFKSALGIPVNQGARMLLISWSAYLATFASQMHSMKSLGDLAILGGLSGFCLYAPVWAWYWLCISRGWRFGGPLLVAVLVGIFGFAAVTLPLGLLFLIFGWMSVVAVGGNAWDAFHGNYLKRLAGDSERSAL